MYLQSSDRKSNMCPWFQHCVQKIYIPSFPFRSSSQFIISGGYQAGKQQLFCRQQQHLKQHTADNNTPDNKTADNNTPDNKTADNNTPDNKTEYNSTIVQQDYIYVVANLN